MIDKILKTIQETGETLKQQTSQLSSGARDKAFAVIDDWLAVFPKLNAYGLVTESFAMGVAISPCLEVDLVGTHDDFTMDKLEQMIAEAEETSLRTVLSTIKTTYSLHRKIGAELREPLIVQVRIRISPEVKVFIGEPVTR